MSLVSTVNIHEAKTHLSRLLSSVAAGHEVVIAKNGVPVARLVSVRPPQARTPGRFAGQIQGVESLLDPMPPECHNAWTEGYLDDPLRQVLTDQGFASGYPHDFMVVE